MQVFQENLMLKEKIREFEVDDLNGSEFNLREKIEHNLLFLTEVAKKMEDSIREKRSLDGKLERMAYLVGITPSDLSKESQDPSQLNDLNRRIETLNYEVLGLKTETMRTRTSGLLSAAAGRVRIGSPGNAPEPKLFTKFAEGIWKGEVMRLVQVEPPLVEQRMSTKLEPLWLSGA